METLKLNLYRFDGADMTYTVKPVVDDSDLLKMVKDLAENKNELIALGQEFGLFQQQLEKTKTKWSKSFNEMQSSISKTRDKLKAPKGSALQEARQQLKPIKDVDLSSIGASSVDSVKSRLQGILTVIENIRDAGSNVNLSGLKDSLESLGLFNTLPESMQNTINNLVKMEDVAKQDSGAVNKLEASLKQTINTLGGVTNKTKENNNEVNNAKQQYISYKDVLDAVNNSVTGLITKFTAFRAIFRRIGSYMATAVTDSSDYVESINLFNMALGDYASGLNDWVKEISEKLYLDPSEVYQYTGSFYNLAKGLGVAGQNAAFMAKNLTQLTYDMTSYLNLKPDVAYNKLLSAMSGQTKAVTNVGIAVQKASLQELANQMGIEKKVETMTQAEKTYLRYIQIMRSTTQMQGDLGRTIITPTNALRLFQTQIKLTARAIGQVLTPIIMSLLPYLIALTQLLQEAAATLASKLGFNLKDYEVDASGISNLFSEISDNADEASASAGKLNRTLAKFDDLNVVENSSAGAGDSALSEADFSKYLDGYDILKDYTAQMADKIAEAKKQLQGLLDIAKTVAGVIAGIFAIKALVSFIKGIKTATTWVTRMWKGWKEVAGVTKGFKGIGAILSGWVKSIGGIGAALNGIALTLAGLVVYVKGFTGINEDIKQLNVDFYGVSEAAEQLRLHVVELVGGFSLLSVGAGVLLGAGGGLLVALTAAFVGLGSVIYSTVKAHEELEYQQALLRTEFANTGPTLDVLSTSFHNMFGAFSTYSSDTQDLIDKIEDSKGTVETAAEAFDTLAFHIKFGDYKGEIDQAYADVTDSLESLTSATTTHYENLKNFQVGELEQLAKDGAMTKSTYEEKKKSVQEYYDMLTGRSAQYNAAYAGYLKQLADGTISQDEYNKKMAELNQQYADIAQSTDAASYSFESYAEAIKDGINIAGADAKELQGSVSDLTSEYEKQRDALKTNYEVQRKSDTEAIAAAKDRLKTYKEDSEEYKKTAKFIEDTQKTMDTNYANYNANMVSLNTTYTTTMSSLYNTMKKEGLDSSKEYKSVMDDIQKHTDEAISYLSKNVGKYTQLNTEDGYALGFAIDDGMMLGIENGQKGVYKAVHDQNTDTIKWIKEDLQIHSPSKVTEKLGGYVAEGFANGIISSDSAKKIDKACKDLVSHVKRGLEGLNTSANFKISVNIEDSFNNILNKLQIFCNNWRNAINDLAKHMQTTMNGIKVDGNGKVSYTKMPTINVKKFEDSGYPKSGEMFFMNENGRAEYMTKVGNKTAVVNQDHMTTALADTITRAIGSIPTGGNTGDIIVYVGNDKVYQGQGEYQSRETDRYGSTYIKI